MRYYTSILLKRDEIESFEHYPYSIPAIRNLDEIALDENVTFIIGENGAGKSTLIEAVAVRLGFNPEGGSKNFNFATRESHSDLSTKLVVPRTPEKPTDGYFLRAESFYNVASELERLDDPSYKAPPLTDAYGGKGLHEQSHGESFFSLLNYRLLGGGFYIFDEPEAALSPQRQLAMLTIMHRLIYHKSQLLIATHSPIIMAYPNATIYQLTDDKIEQVEYKNTEHYQITKTFLDCPERMLHHLLTEEDNYLLDLER